MYRELCTRSVFDSNVVRNVVQHSRGYNEIRKAKNLRFEMLLQYGIRHPYARVHMYVCVGKVPGAGTFVGSLQYSERKERERK